MAKCLKCGSDNAEGAKFCRICGEEMPQTASPEAPSVQEEPEKYDAPIAPEAFAAPAEPEAPAAQFDAPAAPPVQPQYQAPPAPPVQPQYQQPARPQPQPQYAAPAQPAFVNPPHTATAPKTKPEMTWGSFFWTRVLFSIPLIGFIFMMIWACGGSSNKTRVQYARSYLFPGLIIAGIFLIIALIIVIAGSGGDIMRIWDEFVRAMKSIS